MSSPIEIMTGPASAAACLLRGLKMLNRPGLRQYVWIPLAINLALYSLGAWAGAHYFQAVLNWLIPGWLEWLRWLLWPLFALLLLAVAFFTFTVVANLIASPFYGALARNLQITLGIPLPQAAETGFLQGLASEARRMGYFALRALPILLLSIIPGINVFAPFIWMLFGAWSLSLEYRSYPLENLGLDFPRQLEMARERRLETMAFGGVAMLGLGIPLLNILIPPAAVIGATLMASGAKLETNTPP